MVSRIFICMRYNIYFNLLETAIDSCFEQVKIASEQ